MLSIVPLAVGAAFFPALLACVAILISRPQPRRLLFAFYLGGLIVSLASGVVVMKAFEDGRSVAGSTADSPHGSVAIAAGILGLAFAWLLVSARGRRLVESLRSRRLKRRPPRKSSSDPSWVERRLAGASTGVAFAVGAAINLPGPFYLLALGEIARGGYGALEELALILIFNAIMFLMLEVPLVGYLLNPDRTAAAVASFGSWLNANGLRIIGVLIGVFSVSLLVQGAASAL
jgi:Sap-like sulfolipid-1-addressing protein